MKIIGSKYFILRHTSASNVYECRYICTLLLSGCQLIFWPSLLSRAAFSRTRAGSRRYDKRKENHNDDNNKKNSRWLNRNDFPQRAVRECLLYCLRSACTRKLYCLLCARARVCVLYTRGVESGRECIHYFGYNIII